MVDELQTELKEEKLMTQFQFQMILKKMKKK